MTTEINAPLIERDGKRTSTRTVIEGGAYLSPDMINKAARIPSQQCSPMEARRRKDAQDRIVDKIREGLANAE